MRDPPSRTEQIAKLRTLRGVAADGVAMGGRHLEQLEQWAELLGRAPQRSTQTVQEIVSGLVAVVLERTRAGLAAEQAAGAQLDELIEQLEADGRPPAPPPRHCALAIEVQQFPGGQWIARCACGMVSLRCEVGERQWGPWCETSGLEVQRQPHTNGSPPHSNGAPHHHHAPPTALRALQGGRGVAPRPRVGMVGFLECHVCKRGQPITADGMPGGVTKAEARKLGWSNDGAGWRCPLAIDLESCAPFEQMDGTKVPTMEQLEAAAATRPPTFVPSAAPPTREQLERFKAEQALKDWGVAVDHCYGDSCVSRPPKVCKCACARCVKARAASAKVLLERISEGHREFAAGAVAELTGRSLMESSMPAPPEHCKDAAIEVQQGQVYLWATCEGCGATCEARRGVEPLKWCAWLPVTEQWTEMRASDTSTASTTREMRAAAARRPPTPKEQIRVPLPPDLTPARARGVGASRRPRATTRGKKAKPGKTRS